MARALVWFKRDLRLADHHPLAEAARCDEALALFIIEPAWLGSPECHSRHVDHLLKCLAPLREALAARGLPLVLRMGEAVEVLAQLRREWRFEQLFSHEETGPGWSYARDIAVGRWCSAQGVLWTEWPQTGVARRLKERRGWAARWTSRMESPLVPTPAGFRAAPGFSPSALPSLRELGVATAPPTPAAGEAAAQCVLQGFLAGRAVGYRRHLSSPLTAESGCSRLSAHLAFGTVSMRQVHQATEAAIAATPHRDLAHSLRGFASRLRWHCHFIQKLEDEPEIEFRNFARSHDGLRAGDGVHPGEPDLARLQAWREGRTGFPMVDACMRQLCATGWLNFRMRAMLVSFAAYHLGLHWRATGLHLARQFLDYEPGIHWSQMQMQSGTTGINALRIYSPGKQQAEHDPEGRYVRRWLPELGTPAYPQPIVDERAAVADIKARLAALRQTVAARAEADAIQDRHGSRRAGLPPTSARAGGRPPRVRPKPAPDSGQGELF
jgi:deoxyribodipyrimidine photo-lyase